MSDQLPQCSFHGERRRCLGDPIDPAASVPLCLKHMRLVVEDLLARGARVELLTAVVS
ncbi:hypothetical protein [Actinoplanes sp. M2I2]|uniref:hypothetical protein n=1 Tax=Actinoplanes sp. M2I2 TaxID=1734444 RepID=UPI002021FB95|nr:hypothetical protein [Actinoplanes sp. M2I2]